VIRARIVANPADDPEFVATVRRLARENSSEAVFAAQLWTRYPGAVVHSGRLYAEPAERWYVYRDGRWAGDGSDFASATADER
jgi:GH15 family glucan-1,4-alpha-glucosidase